MEQYRSICNKIKLKIKNLVRYIELYFWWVKSYDVKNHILLELSRNVAAALGVKPFKKIKIVYRDDIINAAAIGFTCRTLVVSQGMLNNLTYDELRAVIFHEYAHCQQKHHLKLLAASISAILIGVPPYLYVALYVESVTAFFILAGILFTLTYVIMLLFIRYLTRKFEEEADIIVVKNLEDPRTYLQVLQKIVLRSSNKEGNIIERLFWSHPPVAKRLRKLYRYVLM